MLNLLTEVITQAASWSNDNQGVVSWAIFVITLVFGWASGIFSALRRKPKFRLELIPGPTFCSTFDIGEKRGEYAVHRTAIALYLNIANVGSAASSVEEIHVGYHWDLRRLNLQWLRYALGWFWLKDQAAALADFQVNIGENIKVFPFLTQKNFLMSTKTTTYLDVGRSTNGVVYFEQSSSWGGCYPRVINGKVHIKVCVMDVFGKRHTRGFSIPSIPLEEARKFSPAFGKTLAELHGKPLPLDVASNNASQPTAIGGG